MIDFLRTLKLPLVIFAIVASLWAYARAQSLGQQASQAYWPALSPAPARAAATGPEETPYAAEDFEVELVEVESDVAAPAITRADSSQTR
jgi:hypothetical protein